MPNQPKRTWRRWFQFNLSTWLVLVGIVAWALAQRPYTHPVTYLIYQKPDSAQLERVNRFEGDSWTRGFWPWLRAAVKVSPMCRSVEVVHRPNPALIWPALALAAFLGWKGFCQVRNRPRRDEPSSG
jgi:hypothetical protein